MALFLVKWPDNSLTVLRAQDEDDLWIAIKQMVGCDQDLVGVRCFPYNGPLAFDIRINPPFIKVGT